MAHSLGDLGDDMVMDMSLICEVLELCDDLDIVLSGDDNIGLSNLDWCRVVVVVSLTSLERCWRDVKESRWDSGLSRCGGKRRED